MAKTYKRLLLMLLAVVSCGLIATVPTFAKNGELMISPSRIEVPDAINPGEAYTGTFKVINSGDVDIKYRIYATGYMVAYVENSDSYTQVFDQDGPYTGVAKWFTFSKDTGYLAPGEREEITYTINVPEDAPGGGQYAGIMAEIDNDEDQMFVSKSRVGTLFYSTIAGETRIDAKIIDNKIPSFLFNPPIYATSLVENNGNVHLNASYILQVFPLFSDEEVYTNEEDPETHVVMPETKRFITTKWENSPSFGIFRVIQTVKIADQ
ncbi:hypothetical protein IJG66_01810, partial [Candidatus Saccharibacteria bacterium]|nr:hypothetical protein [Candidatus Saccharibacteria bacterium]